MLLIVVSLLTSFKSIVMTPHVINGIVSIADDKVISSSESAQGDPETHCEVLKIVLNGVLLHEVGGLGEISVILKVRDVNSSR